MALFKNAVFPKKWLKQFFFRIHFVHKTYCPYFWKSWKIKIYVAQSLNLPFFSGACVKHTVGKFYNVCWRYMWLEVLIFHLIFGQIWLEKMEDSVQPSSDRSYDHFPINWINSYYLNWTVSHWSLCFFYFVKLWWKISWLQLIIHFLNGLFLFGHIQERGFKPIM